jgi:hypothetical protein
VSASMPAVSERRLCEVLEVSRSSVRARPSVPTDRKRTRTDTPLSKCQRSLGNAEFWTGAD